MVYISIVFLIKDSSMPTKQPIQIQKKYGRRLKPLPTSSPCLKPGACRARSSVNLQDFLTNPSIDRRDDNQLKKLAIERYLTVAKIPRFTYDLEKEF